MHYSTPPVPQNYDSCCCVNTKPMDNITYTQHIYRKNNKLRTFGTHVFGVNQIFKSVAVLAYMNKTGQLTV